DELRAQCIAFAETIIRRWSGTHSGSVFGPPVASPNLLSMLVALDEPRLIHACFSEVLLRDSSVDPGRSLVPLCQRHGWGTFRPELELVFRKTTTETMERNVRLLDGMSRAKPRDKEQWSELCQSLGQTLLDALEVIDQERKPGDYSWR